MNENDKALLEFASLLAVVYQQKVQAELASSGFGFIGSGFIEPDSSFCSNVYMDHGPNKLLSTLTNRVLDLSIFSTTCIVSHHTDSSDDIAVWFHTSMMDYSDLKISTEIVYSKDNTSLVTGFYGERYSMISGGYYLSSHKLLDLEAQRGQIRSICIAKSKSKIKYIQENNSYYVSTNEIKRVKFDNISDDDTLFELELLGLKDVVHAHIEYELLRKMQPPTSNVY